jgi:hypothetical protein
MKNRVGLKYGRLIVLSLADNKGKKSRWNCLCDCGNKTKVTSSNLQTGHSLSCGCLKAETMSKNMFKHGKVRTRAYQSWEGMIFRCSNKNSTGYKYYGGRGIRVCDRWENFINFHEDMGDCPDGLTIERINTNDDYKPGNCKWATYKEQNLNKRNNRYLSFNGTTKMLREWASDIGVCRSTIYRRIKKGWSIEKILIKDGRQRWV